MRPAEDMAGTAKMIPRKPNFGSSVEVKKSNYLIMPLI